MFAASAWPAPLALLVVLALAPGLAGGSQFVGSKRCGSCHPAELARWAQGPHASAAESLGPSPAAACLHCHTTGGAPTAPIVERAVGCEACHGAGRGYAADDVMRNLELSRVLGLVPLDTARAREELCLSCHRVRTRLEPSVQPGAVERAWERIGHGPSVRGGRS